MITYEDIKRNEEIRACIEKSNEVLGISGITEHGFAHAGRTATIASKLLEDLGYDSRTCELAAIAGYMHDIGNLVNRDSHAHNGAILAFNILHRVGMEVKEITSVVSAIGHHDEKTAAAVSPIAAAVILSDKSDVRRSRVRSKQTLSSDIHDRVNYAVEKSELTIDKGEKLLILQLIIDTSICPVMDYFEIFLERMVLCRKAADYLGLNFELVINNTRLL